MKPPRRPLQKIDVEEVQEDPRYETERILNSAWVAADEACRRVGKQIGNLGASWRKTAEEFQEFGKAAGGVSEKVLKGMQAVADQLSEQEKEEKFEHDCRDVVRKFLSDKRQRIWYVMNQDTAQRVLYLIKSSAPHLEKDYDFSRFYQPELHRYVFEVLVDEAVNEGKSVVTQDDTGRNRLRLFIDEQVIRSMR